MQGESFNNSETDNRSEANPWGQMAEEAGTFNPEQAEQDVAEAEQEISRTQESQEAEKPTIEVTREEIVPGVELVLPQTRVADELLAKHRPQIGKGFEHNKKAWEGRALKLTQSDDEHHIFSDVESVYGTSFRTDQNTDQAITAAVNNQLRFLERKMNGYYDGRQNAEEEDLAKLRGDADNLIQRPGHQANVAAMDNVVNERLREAKLQAVEELYRNAGPIEKMKLKMGGIEDEIKTLREFDPAEFKSAEKAAAERAAYEAANTYTPGTYESANAIQDTLDKIGGEVHSPDIVPPQEQSPDDASSDDSETQPTGPKPTAESVSATTIDNIHQLAQTHDREELLDRIYAEDWINNYDKIVQELFDGDYGLHTQATIVEHMTREEVSRNLEKMLENSTFDAQIVAKKLGKLTPSEAYIFRRNGLNDIADALEVKDSNQF